MVGATGMIGFPLALSLAQKGWTVFATTRPSSDLCRVRQLEAFVRIVPYDLQTGDLSSLPSVDVVFFMAWDRSHHVDCPHRASGVMWCAWCERFVYHLNYFPAVRLFSRYMNSAHIVNASSMFVLGDGVEGEKLYTSACAFAPTSNYGRCRADLEHFLQQFNGQKQCISLRYLNPQDPNHPGLVQRLIDKVVAGQELCDQRRIQIITLADVVSITVHSAQLMMKGVMLPPAINVCHPQLWTERELAQHVANRLSGTPRPLSRPPEGPVKSMVSDAGETLRLCPSLTPIPHLLQAFVTARL